MPDLQDQLSAEKARADAAEAQWQKAAGDRNRAEDLLIEAKLDLDDLRMQVEALREALRRAADALIERDNSFPGRILTFAAWARGEVKP